MGPEREPPTDRHPSARGSRNSAAGESEKPGGAHAAAMPIVAKESQGSLGAKTPASECSASGAWRPPWRA
eukprot:15473072-Alexandrium_andersonii.AAC.1